MGVTPEHLAALRRVATDSNMVVVPSDELIALIAEIERLTRENAQLRETLARRAEERRHGGRGDGWEAP